MLKRKLVTVRLEIGLSLTQDSCMVCAECTIGWKSFWTQLMELLGDVGLVESHFRPFRESISVGARYLHGLCHMYHWLKIVLDAADGTPR